MLERADFEKRELVTLAPYAVFSINSQGRAYPEEVSSLRTEFQRDRDRIIHSKAFRRLKHKTQVFVATEGDHYRTRLTHTLEVAQIARHGARALSLNEDLTETIALAHDLGHTPFGHTGEEVLNEFLKDQGGFEHNRQSRRIVEVLEKKYPEFPGLNLTLEVRDGLIKHRTPFDQGSIDSKQASLEAQICNLADEIAYNSHDLDDGLSAGILQIAQLEKVPLISELLANIRRSFSNLSPQKLQDLLVRNLINFQIVDLLKETEHRLDQYRIVVYEDVEDCPVELAGFSTANRGRIDELRHFLYANFYKHTRVNEMNEQAVEILQTLLVYFQKHSSLLEELPHNEATPLAIKIADYIAGMTDSFAQGLYERIRVN